MILKALLYGRAFLFPGQKVNSSQFNSVVKSFYSQGDSN